MEEVRDFLEDNGSKIKILTNVGISLACIASGIYILKNSCSDYLILIPIVVILFQLGLIYHHTMKARHADINSETVEVATVMHARFDQLVKINNQLRIQINSMSGLDIEPSDSASQVLVMENCNYLPSQITTSQNNAVTTA